MIDPFDLLEDLQQHEFLFQYRKALLVMQYLDCYEHICDPLEQQRIMQLIVDVMGRRPRLEPGVYFVETYKAEEQVLITERELVRDVVEGQMRREREENRAMKEYLQMTYRISNEYVNKQWGEQN